MTSVFDDVDALEKVAVNLFYGWGYNFYRLENQLRADDLAVRAKVGWLLGQARDAVERAESAWRRAHLPPPTREKPLPDPAAVEGARRLEALSREIGALEGQIRAQPVPEADHMTNRYRREARDAARAAAMRPRAGRPRRDAARAGRGRRRRGAARARAAEIEAGCEGLARSLRERQAILHV